MIEAICNDIKKTYNRVVAIGGGTVLDCSKLFALKQTLPVTDLFDKKIPAIKDKPLLLVPTTCGTGSEMTNISILEFKQRHTKFGLAVDELYADEAILVPELLYNLETLVQLNFRLSYVVFDKIIRLNILSLQDRSRAEGSRGI